MININLLPWREKDKVFQARQFWLMFFFCLLFLFIVCYQLQAYAQAEIDKKMTENIKLKNEISILDSRLSAIKSLQKEKEDLLARIRTIQSLQADRSRTVKLLETIVRAVPDGLYLTLLSREGDKVFMEGHAESNSQVAQFMRNIEETQALYAPELSVIQATEETGNLIGFNLRATEQNESIAMEDSQ